MPTSANRVMTLVGSRMTEAAWRTGTFAIGANESEGTVRGADNIDDDSPGRIQGVDHQVAGGRLVGRKRRRVHGVVGKQHVRSRSIYRVAAGGHRSAESGAGGDVNLIRRPR